MGLRYVWGAGIQPNKKPIFEYSEKRKLEEKQGERKRELIREWVRSYRRHRWMLARWLTGYRQSLSSILRIFWNSIQTKLIFVIAYSMRNGKIEDRDWYGMVWKCATSLLHGYLRFSSFLLSCRLSFFSFMVGETDFMKKGGSTRSSADIPTTHDACGTAASRHLFFFSFLLELIYSN